MTVTVKMLVDKVKLKVVYGNDELLAKEITTADISRPGLEMTGYFDYYSPERLQLLGMKEWTYLMKMTSHNRYQVLTEMIKPETPAIIVARKLEVPEEMLAAAKEKALRFCKVTSQPVACQVKCLGTWILALLKEPAFMACLWISTAWVS